MFVTERLHIFIHFCQLLWAARRFCPRVLCASCRVAFFVFGIELCIVGLEKSFELWRQARACKLRKKGLEHNQMGPSRHSDLIFEVGCSLGGMHFGKVSNGRGKIGKSSNRDLLGFRLAEQVLEDDLLNKNNDKQCFMQQNHY